MNPLDRSKASAEPLPSALRWAQLAAAGEWDGPAQSLAALARIREGDARVGAFTTLLDEAGVHAAALRANGPLKGVPVAVKDIFDSVDLPTGYGSPVYPPAPARHDAAIVSVLREAGALVIGKATTTEFAFLHPTRTLNPNAPGRTPGGSSAGSAAAVAAGLVPLAVGTQTGGSVIRPASYCGVVGYKPSFGWLPTGGLKCFSWSLDTVGLFARSVDDIAWFGSALAGRALQPASVQGVDRSPAGRPWVIGLPEAYPWGTVSTSASMALARSVAALRHVGVEVRTIRLPDAVLAGFDAHASIQGYEACRCLAREWRDHRESLSQVLRDYLDESAAIDAARYEAGQERAQAARQAFEASFDGLDAILTPSAPDEPPAGFGSTGASTFNRLWTLLGGPCLGVPAGLGATGFPMGVQLVAPWGGDRPVLQLGMLLERALREGGGST